MKRYQLINIFIERYKYKRYLEIGVESGECFKNVICEFKDSVDPYLEKTFLPPMEYPVTYKLTSNDFFKNIAPTLEYKYDIIFIDGLHLSEQVNMDIENSLKYLNDNGTIILHDCNPINYETQVVPRIYEFWSGDVWKSIVNFKLNRKDLDIFVIDTDTGLGVIRKNDNKNENQKIQEVPNWDYFNIHRKELLNLITLNDFIIDFFKKII